MPVSGSLAQRGVLSLNLPWIDDVNAAVLKVFRVARSEACSLCRAAHRITPDPLRPSALVKWIEDHNALHVSSVRHILGVKLPAPKRASGGDDGAVPIRETVLRFDI